MKYLQKIIKIGVYFFLFILPIQTRLIFGNTEKIYLEYERVSIYISDFILLFIFLSFVFLKFFKQGDDKNLKMSQNIIISILDLFIFISIFHASNKSLAVYKYSVFLFGIWFFYMLNGRYFNFDRVKLVYSFILGLVLQACIGIYQFMTQNVIANKYFGIAVHNPGELGTSVVQISDGQRWLRAYGGLGHPNIFSGIMAIGLLFVVGIFLSKKSRKDDSCFESCILLLSYVLMLFALFFSFSRAGWLSFAISIFFVLAWYLAENWGENIKKVIQIVVLSSIVSIVFFINYSDLILTRVKGGTRLENKSQNERVEYLQYAKEMIDDNVINGVGIGNYSINFQKIKKGESIWFYQPVHNVFILILAEVGIGGLLSYLGFLFYVFYLNFKKRQIINLSIFFSFAILMMFDHWLWSLHFGVLFFWVSMAMIVKYKF